LETSEGLGLLDREDASTTIRQNVRNYLPIVTAENTRRFESPDFKLLMQFGYIWHYEISQVACSSMKFFTVNLTTLTVVETVW
jgi:hypothetical protein